MTSTMITADDIDKMTSEQRQAWHDSMTDDEWRICCLPSGYCYDLVVISVGKRHLTQKISAEDQIRILEGLNKIPHGILTMEALALVEPACNAAMAMWNEMQPLAMLDKLRLMRRWEVFNSFVKLNPSILAAIKHIDPHVRPRAAAA